MNWVLCGLPSSGKTTVGKILAERLSIPFVDTDRLIERAFYEKCGLKKTCRGIFFLEGEDYFRRLEKEQIASLSNKINHVIALGGGSLLEAENVLSLKLNGLFVYLKTFPHQIWERIQYSQAAYLSSGKKEERKKAFDSLAKERMMRYESVADIVVPTVFLTPQQIVNLILEKHGK